MPYISEEQLSKILSRIDKLEKSNSEKDRKLSFLDGVFIDGKGRITFSGGHLKVNSNVDTKSLLVSADVSNYDDSSVVKRIVALEDKCANINRIEGRTFIGDYVNGDCSEFESDGTLVFNGDATTFEDINFPLIVKTTGVGRPVYATYLTPVESLQWAVNDICQTEDQEIPHKYKLNSQMVWHVHFYNAVQDVSDRYVKWQIDQSYAKYGSASSSIVTLTAEQLIPANTPARTHFLLPIGNFTPSNITVGTHIKASLKRIAASGTAPSVNPFCELMQLHYEIDMGGSRLITQK